MQLSSLNFPRVNFFFFFFNLRFRKWIIYPTNRAISATLIIVIRYVIYMVYKRALCNHPYVLIEYLMTPGSPSECEKAKEPRRENETSPTFRPPLLCLVASVPRGANRPLQRNDCAKAGFVPPFSSWIVDQCPQL